MTSQNSFMIVGPSNFLPNLRADLRQAKVQVLVIGPWIDAHFCNELVSYAKKRTPARILTRPLDDSQPEDSMSRLNGLKLLSKYFQSFTVKFLDTLHAKVVLIDDVCYLGSMNWYKYSMENPYELVLRVATEKVEGLEKEVLAYWGKGSRVDLDKIGREIKSEIINEGKSPSSFEAIDKEILDPLARRVLEENPKAFILRRKSQKRKPSRASSN